MVKKALLLIITAILVSAGFVIYYFITNPKSTSILNHVPADANSVLFLDIKGLATKLAIDEISSSQKSSGKLLNMLPDSLKEIDFANSGLNLFESAVVFAKEEQQGLGLYALLPVVDSKQLLQFIDSLQLSHDLEIDKSRNGTFVYSERYSVLAAFNRSIFIATKTDSTEHIEAKQRIQNILNIKPENSFGNDSLFVNKLSRNHDVFMYSTPYKYIKGNIASILNDNIKSSSFWVSFEDGKIKIKSEIKQKKGGLLNEALSNQENNIQTLKQNDSTGLNLALNVKPEPFLKLINGISKVKFNYDKVPIIKAWNGAVNIIFNKGKIIESEYVSYEYDDDFNKVEVRKIVKNKIIDVQANIGTDKTKKDSLLKKYKFPKDGKDSLLYTGSNFIISSIDNGYLCYNKHLDLPKLTDEKTDTHFLFTLTKPIATNILKELNIINDSSIYNQLDFNQFKIVANKKEFIESELTLQFNDNSRNAFFIVMEQILEFKK